MDGLLTGSIESSEVRPSGKSIKIDGRGRISTVAFLVDGKHVVSGDENGKIRRWRIEDGMQVGTSMDAGFWVRSIAVSRDGKWIVCGTLRSVQVWNAESGKKVSEIGGHNNWVDAVDVSPDSTKIASESGDRTACVWSLSTGQRLLGPWVHNSNVLAVKFSPDGRFIATASRDSIWIYDSQSGNLVDVPIEFSRCFASSSSVARLAVDLSEDMPVGRPVVGCACIRGVGGGGRRRKNVVARLAN